MPSDWKAGSRGYLNTGLQHLNSLGAADFAQALDGVFEHAPWVPAAVAGQRPFADIAALHAAMLRQVREAPPERLSQFLNGHPELVAGALPSDLTAASHHEQSGVGFGGVAGAATLPALNRAYRERFGFPFIICLRQHTAANALRQLRQRLTHPPKVEQAAALAEISRITRLRLDALLAPDQPAEGGLVLQVLRDGQAATGLPVRLLREGRRIATRSMTEDGSLALLPAGPLRMGRYALQLRLGAWREARGEASRFDLLSIPFLIDVSQADYRMAVRLEPEGYAVRLDIDRLG